MSTINSYFKARKNKNAPVYISDKAKAHGTVIQAPGKIQQSSPSKKESSPQPKGILRFMSPIKQGIKKDEEEDEHIVCKIKKPTKITDFWKDVVDNYDAESPLMEVEEDCGKKRTHNDSALRNVRIRVSHQTLQSTIPDIYDDDDEDLTRPIRRLSLTETNEYLLEIINELFLDDNNWCKLQPISTVS